MCISIRSSKGPDTFERTFGANILILLYLFLLISSHWGTESNAFKPPMQQTQER